MYVVFQVKVIGPDSKKNHKLQDIRCFSHIRKERIVMYVTYKLKQLRLVRSQAHNATNYDSDQQRTSTFW
jgi:hypothetical protein